LFLKSVPTKAKQFMSMLERLPYDDPEYVAKLVASVSGFYNSDDSEEKLWNFALVHQPGGNFGGVILIATQKFICVLDAESLRSKLRIDWPWVCRFDVNYEDDAFQIVGLSFFRGDGLPADRAATTEPLTDAEVENWYFYTHADQEFFDFIIDCADEGDVLSSVDDGVRLL